MSPIVQYVLAGIPHADSTSVFLTFVFVDEDFGKDPEGIPKRRVPRRRGHSPPQDLIRSNHQQTQESKAGHVQFATGKAIQLLIRLQQGRDDAF